MTLILHRGEEGEGQREAEEAAGVRQGLGGDKIGKHRQQLTPGESGIFEGGDMHAKAREQPEDERHAMSVMAKTGQRGRHFLTTK
jgi:hypothetical protein